jgi:hypothetical protein
MPFRSRSHLCTVLTLILAAGAVAMAAPVSGDQARSAVQRWLQLTPRPLNAALTPEIEQVLPHADQSGQTLYHEVRFAGGGFVVVAPDDLLEPVIAFSSQGSLEEEPGGLLERMLQRDLPARLAALQAKGGPFLAAAATGSKWDLLLGKAVSSDATPLDGLDDVRVEPLIQSLWNQGNVSGYPTYNFFSPNNYPIGCVATAIGQLMRFHQFPVQGIGVHPFTVKVDKVAQTLSTRGGDGLGGAYVWSQMPLTVNALTSDAQRQMIGSLLFDMALSVRMDFASTGSGAVTGDGAAALKNTFGYANAMYGFNGGSELLGHGLAEMVEPNLDAGLPVVLAITGDGGHAVVCDGYGYNTGSLYHHLNLGWGGNSNAWYNLPDIGTSYHFNLVHGCLYNVFKAGTGDLLSGRVTDAAGNPVSGVQVSNGSASATTSVHGQYALTGVKPGIQTISASKAGASYSQAVRILENASVSYGAVGNLRAVNLVQGAAVAPAIYPQPQAQEGKVGGSATFTAGASGTGPLHFQWLKDGAAVGGDSPSCTLSGLTSKDSQAAIQVRVSGPQSQVLSAQAPLSVVYLLNGAFEKGNLAWSLYDPGVVLGSGAYDEVEPHSGGGWLCIGDWTGPVTDYAIQDLQVPAEARSADLSLWLGIANKSKTPATKANLFRVLVLDASDAILATLAARDNTMAEVDGSGKVVWKALGPFSLLPYKGRTIKLRIESAQGGGSDTGTVFAVDDVALAVATGASATVAPAALTLATGGQASFKATVTGYSADNRVNWTSAGGSFSPAQTAGDGAAATLFSAGANPGVFSLAATPVEAGASAGAASVTLVSPASVAVSLTPASSTILTGASVAFSSAVTLLSDASTLWSKSGGSFTATAGNAATWTSSQAGTFTVTASSAGAPTRSASATVTVIDGAAIQPVFAQAALTALAGASVTLTVTGDQGCGVDWAVSAPATHLDNGLACTVTLPPGAPLASSVTTVTATSKVLPARAASAAITVKGLDLNGDKTLDPLDLLVFAREWGKGAVSPANLKGAGTVDDTDLNALLGKM